MSLTACLKKAGAVITTADRGAILSRARELRATGVDTKAAAVQAVQERLEAVHAEMKPLLQAAFRKAEPVATNEPAANAFDAEAHHRAFHGSPHHFDKFSTDRIGTGEGAQAYGHGLYFAENQGVADTYRRTLSIRDPSALQRHALSKGASPELADTLAQYYAASRTKDFAGFKEEMEQRSPSEYIELFRNKWIRPAIADGSAESIFKTFREAGALYQVDIPDEAVAKMLLWDKPLSEQPESVKKAIREFALTEEMPKVLLALRGITENERAVTGESFYRMLAEDVFKGPEIASEELNAMGIPGIKYLDGNSRNRPLKDIKREFLAELPEDADFNDVMDKIGDGTFSPANEAILKALKADDWLGFDYPSQALSAALGGKLSNFDASPALVKAVADAQVDATHNLVVFNDKNVTLTHKDGSPVSRQERAEFMDGALKRGEKNSTQPPDSARTEQVQKTVNEITSRWKNGPEVTVVPTAADLPGENPPDARGLYHNGKVWIVAEAPGHDTRAGIASTLAHEAVAHFGLRDMLGQQDWTRLMRNIQMGVKAGNAELGRIREQVKAVYREEDGSYSFEKKPLHEADEIAAKAIEEAIDADGNFKPGFGFLKSVWAKVAQFLRDHGINVQFTNSELQGMLVDAMRHLEAGQRTAGGARMAVAAARDERVQARSGGDVTVKQIGDRWAVVRKARTGGEEHLGYFDTEQQARDAADVERDAARTTASRSAGAHNSRWWIESPTQPIQSTRLGRLSGVDRQRALQETLAAQRNSIKSRSDADGLEQIQDRAGYCFTLAGQASAAGLGDMVIGVARDSAGAPIWHAVVMRDGMVYDPTYGRWFEPGVYERLGFKPRLTLTTEQVQDHLASTRGVVPDARNQGLGDAPGSDPFTEPQRARAAPASEEERTAKLADRVGAGYHAYGGVEQVPRESKGSVADSIAKALVPAGRKDATLTAGIIRANLGEQAREREVAQQHLMEFAKRFDKMPVAENYAFIDAMERGVPLKDPELSRAAVALRKVLDERRDQVIALGKGNLENFNENYFPHIWKDRTAASNFFTRRPLEGGKGFLKQRTYDFFADGLKAGLEPVTTNPVELAMLKAREMDRYIYGQRIFQEMKDAGVAKFVGFGAKPPEGWEKINDKIARVLQYSETEKGMILRGEYYAPEQAATLINNHLSPGLSGVAAFDMVRKAGNMMNAVQLGLSAFHLGFTTLDAMISKAALGIKQATRGNVLKGLGNMAQSLNPAQPFMNLYKGNRLLKAYLGNVNDPDMAPIVEALTSAGGRVKMDDVYRNAAANEFRQAVRKGKWGTAAMQALPRALDLLNKPIFEMLVPRQKLGVFFDMAKDALEHEPGMDIARKREVMGKLWDSVDNRMGELVYDNVLWNRALKDALQVSVRSVGWNLGTFREIGGGVKDIGSIRKIGGLSDRTSYIFALTFVTAVIGSLTQYLLTGESPKELKDVFFPRTGKQRPDGTEDRLSLPSYMKDIYEYGHDLRNFAKYGEDPFHTLENKLHPLISTMVQGFTNKDFFGGAIRSPGDSTPQQALDEANYLLKQMTPFSLRNYQQQAKVKGEEPTVLGYLSSPSMIGITPAPGYITKNDEQAESSQVNKMRESLVTKFREEMRDGADWGEIRQRAMDAGIRGQDLEFIRRSAVQRPPKRLKEFGTH